MNEAAASGDAGEESGPSGKPKKPARRAPAARTRAAAKPKAAAKPAARRRAPARTRTAPPEPVVSATAAPEAPAPEPAPLFASQQPRAEEVQPERYEEQPFQQQPQYRPQYQPQYQPPQPVQRLQPEQPPQDFNNNSNAEAIPQLQAGPQGRAPRQQQPDEQNFDETDEDNVGNRITDPDPLVQHPAYRPPSGTAIPSRPFGGQGMGRRTFGGGAKSRQQFRPGSGKRQSYMPGMQAGPMNVSGNVSGNMQAAPQQPQGNPQQGGNRSNQNNQGNQGNQGNKQQHGNQRHQQRGNQQPNNQRHNNQQKNQQGHRNQQHNNPQRHQQNNMRGQQQPQRMNQNQRPPVQNAPQNFNQPMQNAPMQGAPIQGGPAFQNPVPTQNAPIQGGPRFEAPAPRPYQPVQRQMLPSAFSPPPREYAEEQPYIAPAQAAPIAEAPPLPAAPTAEFRPLQPRPEIERPYQQPVEAPAETRVLEPLTAAESEIDAEAQALAPATPGVDLPPLPALPAEFTEEPEETPLEEEEVQPQKPRVPTGREMLINVVEGEEVRIAIARKGLLEELSMERASSELHVGNIYKGRVTNVEPSIQAAFIDFGIGKNGFLHISDLHPQYFSRQHQPKMPRQPNRQQPQLTADGAPASEAAPAGGTPDQSDATIETPPNGAAGNGGGIYGNGEMEADEMENMDYEVEDGHLSPMERVGRKTPRFRRPPIQQCLRRGQEVIVQVTKEGIGTKGPTLTTYISIPGRYLVMMPGMSALGVSRKIEDEQIRRDLRRKLQELHPPKNLGFIIRTAGLDISKKELQQDLSYLVRMWRVMAQRIRTQRSPVEIYQESDLVIRTIRDIFTNDIDRIVVDNEKVATQVRDFLSVVNPQNANLVELYTGNVPLFHRFNVERQIETIHSRRVEMPNGGSLVIDSTEALVAIDVNSGRYREQRDAELTAFNMNKDVVKEVCRQLRLRDLGGVIVIDFIDMREERHKREIERLLKEELEHDRAKTKVLRMSLFCMVELTRQRVKPSLKRSIYMDCPHCHGSALIKTPESVSLDVMRRIAVGASRADAQRIEARVHPSVASFLLNRKRKQLVELEDKTLKRIGVVADPSVGGDTILIEAFDARNTLLNLNL